MEQPVHVQCWHDFLLFFICALYSFVNSIFAVIFKRQQCAFHVYSDTFSYANAQKSVFITVKTHVIVLPVFCHIYQNKTDLKKVYWYLKSLY